MGLILRLHGRFSVERRRESFIIHHENSDPDVPDPEFGNHELDNLIEALVELYGDLNPDDSERVWS